ncbi:MAG: hypothetical protein GY870_04925 [archaeon]|nr:hypothetical protein [archaeon]
MSIKEADDFLKEDINSINILLEKFKKTKNKSLILAIAQKSDSLGDLYLETSEEFNKRYYKYKLQSAEYYERFSKEMNLINSKVLSILLYLQADKPNDAKKSLSIVRKKQKSKNKAERVEIDEDMLSIIDLFLIPDLKRAEKSIKTQKAFMDENIHKFFVKTLDILKQMEK